MTLFDWHSVGRDHLYMRSVFGSDSYSIWATDLSQLWHEELERDDIVWQVNKNRIPIDVEDANNFSILLKHLASAVKAGELDISDKKSNRLELRASIKLPDPLPEASWTFRLELQDAEDFRKQVTLPLFDQVQSQQHNEQDLIQRIQDKDHIIDKLLDALDKHKVDLAGIFPALVTQAPARRTSIRAEAETRIPALRPFDQQVWHQDHQDGHSSAAQVPRDTTSAPIANGRPEGEVSDPIQEAHNNHMDTDKAPSVPSRGIRRTIGSRKPPPSPSPPPAVDEPTASETEEEPAPVAPARRGLKRTIGSRRPAARAPSAAPEEATGSVERAATELPDAVAKDIPQEINGGAVKEQEEQEVDPDEALRRADNKRKALQRQLAQNSAPKAKKRKF